MAGALVGVALVAHLRRLLGPTRRLGSELAGLPDRPGQRLLGVDVLPRLERHHRRHGVRVVGRRDGHGVDVSRFLIEHLAVVAILLRLGEGVEAVRRVLEVDVAEGVDVLDPAHAADVAFAHTADADAGDVELVARRDVAFAEHMGGDDGESSRGRGNLADK